MACFDEVVVCPNKEVNQTGGDSTSSSIGGDEVLNSGGIHGDGGQTMFIIKMNLS